MTGLRRPCGHCAGTGQLKRTPHFFSRACPHCSGLGYVELTNVVQGNFVTRLDTDPDRVLQGAVGKLQSVVVIGYGVDGEEYYASSIADGPNALWLLRRMEHNLLTIVDKEE